MRINSWCGWDPLEEVWVGRHHLPEYFDSIPIQNIREPLKKIAEETEEDYQSLIKILKDYGVQKILRPSFNDTTRYGDGVPTHATNPRDYHWVYGNTLYRFESKECYNDLYQEYQSEGHNIYDPYNKGIDDRDITTHRVSAPSCVRFGDAILIDQPEPKHMKWFRENLKDTKIVVSVFGGHADGVFCPVKSGLIVTTSEYKEKFKDTIFKNWEFVYTDHNSWEQTKTITGNINVMLRKTKNRWYVSGEENNNELIHFVDRYLSEWVGYCAESVFDVNMLVLDQHNVIVNSYNKKIFDAFKKHKIEPIICNLRHRWFWDGGLHCNTLDIRRRGKKERYLNYAD
jgi:hypothetical protein